MSCTTLPQFILLLLSFYSLASFAEVIAVTDYKNEELVLEKPAKRIISLGPHITENIYTAGAGDLLVGVIAYSDFPIQAKELPIVGSAQGLSIEKIVSLSPDLIIAWSSGISQKTLTSLKALGIPVYHDEPKTLDDIAQSILDIGRLTDRKAPSEQAATEFLASLEQLREQYSDRLPISIFYQIWDKPLMTLSGEHIVSDVMQLCGGRNSFADAVVVAPTISREAVLIRDPDTIISSGLKGQTPNPLASWDSWPELTAVKNGHLFLMPPDIFQRHSVRLLTAAKVLCEHLETIRATR